MRSRGRWESSTSNLAASILDRGGHLAAPSTQAALVPLPSTQAALVPLWTADMTSQQSKALHEAIHHSQHSDALHDDPGKARAYLAMTGVQRSPMVGPTTSALPRTEQDSWQPVPPGRTLVEAAPQKYGAPIHRRLELPTSTPKQPRVSDGASLPRLALPSKGPMGTARPRRPLYEPDASPRLPPRDLPLGPPPRPVRVEWCLDTPVQAKLPQLAPRATAGFAVSQPLEEELSSAQIDDCELAEHYTPCGALRNTAPHVTSQMHVHKVSSMLVMIKTVKLGEIETARQRHRAVTEWRLLRGLRHVHVARLLHVVRGEATGATLSNQLEALLLVSEYCAGGSLELHLQTYGALEERLAARLVGQLLSALSYCHERQVFHRAVRASNVLLDAGRRNCKLADFSAAVRTTALSLTAPSTNELRYQAPEVATGAPYSGGAADAWALGVVGYCCLCGRAPFEAKNTAVLVRRMRQRACRPLPPHLSREAAELLFGALLVVPPHLRPPLGALVGHAWFEGGCPPPEPRPRTAVQPAVVKQLGAAGMSTRHVHASLGARKLDSYRAAYMLLAEQVAPAASAPAAAAPPSSNGGE